MILLAVYLLAGLTIGRMAYEFDVFSEGRPQTMRDRRIEVFACWVTVLLWPCVPALGLWNWMTGRR